MRTWVLIMLAFALAGCGEGEMAQQPKNKPYRGDRLFPDKASSQTPPADTVARGEVEAEAVAAQRPAMTAALLARGQERFDIFCAPCHGGDGAGNGLVPQRGYPHPPTYHQSRLRAASDRYFMDVIANGSGVMYPYGSRIPSADRWAIVAYIRALQLSQNTPVHDLDAEARGQLAAAP